MKSRRMIIALFLTFAVVTIGIGYAALNDTLDVTGTAEVNASNTFDDLVYFANPVAVNAANGDTAGLNPNSNDKANFTARSLAVENDTASFTYTIQNDSDVSVTVKVTASTVSVNDEMFDISLDWGEINTTRTIVARGSETITVTVKLTDTPEVASETATTGSFAVELSVVGASASN